MRKLLTVIIVLFIVGTVGAIYEFNTNPLYKLKTKGVESVEVSVRRYDFLDNYEFNITVQEGVELLEILKDSSGKYKGDWIDLGMVNYEVVIFHYKNGDSLVLEPKASYLSLVYNGRYYFLIQSDKYIDAVSQLVEDYM
jgi:hypothetical protein